MTLEEIEQTLVTRLQWLMETDGDANSEGILNAWPFEDYLRCYEVLAQVKQAQHLENIHSQLDLIRQLILTHVDK